jgi:23S rRNA pseudouridine2605 synthase
MNPSETTPLQKEESRTAHGPENHQDLEDAFRPIAIEDVVSGHFDQSAEGVISPLITKRVLAPQAESPKLHKVLAQAGLGSRLEMEQLMLEGRI